MMNIMGIEEITKEELELAIEAIKEKRLDDEYAIKRALAEKAYNDFLNYCKKLEVEPRLRGGYIYKNSKLKKDEIYFPIKRNSIW